MKLNPILCEVVEVKTDSKTCIGVARTVLGEKFIIDGRTPPGDGMCSNAFGAISNLAFVMMCTDNLEGEKDGAVERVCPHGVVTYRLSRAKEGKEKPFETK